MPFFYLNGIGLSEGGKCAFKMGGRSSLASLAPPPLAHISRCDLCMNGKNLYGILITI